jgi:hypothetical protein
MTHHTRVAPQQFLHPSDKYRLRTGSGGGASIYHTKQEQ